MKKLLLTIITLSLITACATTSENGKQRFKMYDDYIVENQLTSTDKIRTFKFQGWKSLDNYHLILSSLRKKQYLITLQNYCNDLDYVPSITLKQTMNSSLSAKFDSIVVSRQPQQECRIKSIHELDKDQEKQVLGLRKANK